ncbi:MAG TPA: PPOX class F420-dependent oxidoreductase [Chloroflexota bacterium]|nr:PPOX class F420-dependent oxidoreductase [Chloroflexota bacterium]
MTVQIPESHADLLTREKKAFAHLALVTSKGEPQVTPMWFDYDGKYIIFNTARGRVKDRIMHRRPTVALAISDPANPYRYLQIRGPVVEEDEAGGWEQICSLNQKYHGHPNYPKRPGEVRVTYKVRPERISVKS